tara:strand:+ start:803 stop:1531 length:729 start_codon:yes stop_codon:yes gene_type:complete
MKVLSIDLDYFMSPTIELYNSLLYDKNPSVRWKKLFDNTHFKENHLIIDQSNLLFCFDVFLKALKNCDNVSFGYEHDAILYGIKNFSNIDLINIDHHDDVLGGDYANEMNYNRALSKEYDEVVKFEKVHEGNWISWLASHNKINSCVWIGSKNSLSKDRNYFNEKIIPNYTNVEKEEYKFENFDFDFIFVCLSPQYVPKNHWHYFKMFISTYEQFKEKDAIIINRKHEHEFRYSKLNDEILY